jgi:hypothetical protein
MKKIITLASAIIASVVIALPIIPPMTALAASSVTDKTVKTVAPMKDTGVASGVTKMQALDIALKHAGYEMDDTLYTKVKKDYDGMEVYEVEFRVGFVEYNYSIEVASGQIIDFEIDD